MPIEGMTGTTDETGICTIKCYINAKFSEFDNYSDYIRKQAYS